MAKLTGTQKYIDTSNMYTQRNSQSQSAKRPKLCGNRTMLSGTGGARAAEVAYTTNSYNCVGVCASSSVCVRV